MTFAIQDLLNILVMVVGVAYLMGQFRERLELRDWKEWRKTVDKGHERMSDLTGQVQVIMLDAARREVRLTELERRCHELEQDKRR